MEFSNNAKFFIVGIVSAFFLLFLIVNIVLAISLLFLFILCLTTFMFLQKVVAKDKKLYTVCFILLLTHLSFALFIYYANFKPFGGGSDADMYHQTAVEIANRIRSGIFSLDGLYSNHYFPVIIGIIYFLTLSEMIIGQMFAVWLALVSIILLYFLTLEIGGSKKYAFCLALVVIFYPSYLYFGSILLKDTLIIPLVLSGLLLSVKIFKNFTIGKFLGFFAVLTLIIHFRFYVGYALMFSFIILWFFISNLEIKKRSIIGVVIILLLGFSAQISGYGYYGLIPLKEYLNKETITTYREVVYAPIPKAVALLPTECNKCNTENENYRNIASSNSSSNQSDGNENYRNIASSNSSSNQSDGVGSSFVIKTGFENPFTFLLNYLASFMCALLGPFFWAIKQKRQFIALFEVIPWYFLFGSILHCVYKSFRAGGFLNFIKEYKYALHLFLFSVMVLGAVSLYINNFGIIMRIRIPAFIALLAVGSLCYQKIKFVKIKNNDK